MIRSCEGCWLQEFCTDKIAFLNDLNQTVAEHTERVREAQARASELQQENLEALQRIAELKLKLKALYAEGERLLAESTTTEERLEVAEALDQLATNLQDMDSLNDDRLDGFLDLKAAHQIPALQPADTGTYERLALKARRRCLGSLTTRRFLLWGDKKTHCTSLLSGNLERFLDNDTAAEADSTSIENS